MILLNQYMIFFTKHAKDKFDILQRHNFPVSEKQVLKAIDTPDLIDVSRAPLFIAQFKIDAEHVLKVAYKKEMGNLRIITFVTTQVL